MKLLPKQRNILKW